MNNDIIGYVVEVNPERKVIISQQSWSDSERQKCTMVSGPPLYVNQSIVVVKLDIANKSHDIRNIIFNVRIWKIAVAVVIGEIYITNVRYGWWIHG